MFHRVKLEPFYLINKQLLSKDSINNQKPYLYQSTNKKNCGKYWLKFINDMNKFLDIDNLLKQFEYITYFSDWNYLNKNYNIPTLCKVVTRCKKCQWKTGCNMELTKIYHNL